MSQTHRSLLRAEIVVETNGSPEAHDRIMRYVADVTQNAAKNVRGGAVFVRVNDLDGANYGFAGHGNDLTEESKENIDFLFEEN